ncbi:DNA replication/repair protein RecF [Thermithiobacillus plumbiphilus]|uniref:DNA replication and repair protein RecF n=1 Tax=Thermithiobacillus plumbiphilus TaxID=1729899 RepID=A0ABU9D9L6_9PROT
MHLALVHIQNLRCLQDLRFKPGPRWNWLLGNNGQGKTSVLEGIFMLGTGNSFRDRGEGMIRLTATEMLVFGEIEGDGKHHRVGILRDRHTRTIKIDGQVVDSAWRLLEIMPILAMTADNSQILSDSPQQRRRLLDWGLFHVEPRYGELLQGFRRALRQRNAWLKSRPAGNNPWDRPFLDFGLGLEQLRQDYISALTPYFTETLAQFGREKTEDASLQLLSGWSRQKSLETALEQDARRDLDAGFTHSGPHRADLTFKWQEWPAAQILSRGQIKLWSYAFRLAQLRYLRAQRGIRAVVLLDDFGAELDPDAREALLQTLQGMELQVFATVTHQSQIPAGASSDAQVFGLEAGNIRLIEGKAA